MNLVLLLILGSLTIFCSSLSTSNQPSTFKGSRVWFHHSGVGRGVQVRLEAELTGDRPSMFFRDSGSHSNQKEAFHHSEIRNGTKNKSAACTACWGSVTL